MGFSILANMIREAVSGGSRQSDLMSADKALTYSAVKFCVDKISSHIGQLPLNLHKITKDRNEKITNHPGYRLLRVRSNAYQTPFMFKRQMMTHALLWGNGRAYIWRNGGTIELIPLLPDRCESMLVEGEKVHWYKPDRDERLSLADDIRREMAQARKEGRPANVIALQDRDVIHWHGLGFDGVQGKSVIEMARNSFNIGIGQEASERNRQKKGYSGGLFFEAPEGALMREEDAREFIKRARQEHGGDSGEIMGLLRGGIKAKMLAMSNSDAQFIESRKFQREDVMLWFGMPTMPGDAASQSYNSLEQKNLSYRIDCLGPWMTIIEEETEAKLLTEAELRNGFYFKFNDGAILRTDKQTTSQIASTLIAARVINPNEAREWFELNPYEGGEVFENPAISTGTPGEQDDASQDDPPAPSQETSARMATMEHMIGVEARRCVDACKSENFVSKIEKFYERWIVTLANKLESVGVDRDMASVHCEESKERILAAAGKATTQEELRQLVAAEVQNWAARAAGLIEEAEAIQC